MNAEMVALDRRPQVRARDDSECITAGAEASARQLGRRAAHPRAEVPAKPCATGPAATLYRPLSAFVVRAPLLPMDDYGDLAGSGAGDRRPWADPAIRFAVRVASPDLASALDRAGDGAQALPERARLALQRYLIRSSTRPTPFGAFASVGLGRWADRTDLALAAGPRPSRTRPDMTWLTGFAQAVADDPQHRDRLRLVANPCCLEREGRVYLAEPGTAGVDAGPDVSVRATGVVRHVLEVARHGVPRDELRADVAARWPEAGGERVDRLLDDLCAQHLLMPAVLPSLTDDPAALLERELTAARPGSEPAARLRAVRQACAAVDAAYALDTTPAVDTAAPPERALAAARALLRTERHSRADGPPDNSGTDDRDLLQVDTGLPLAGSGLDRQVGEEVARAADVLLRLHPAPQDDRLAAFRAEFHRRYGDDRPVPLLELIDPRFGLGPVTPGGGHAHGHVRGHAGHAPGRSARQSGTSRRGEWWPHRWTALGELAAAAARDGARELELTDDLVERLAGWAPQPASLAPSMELSVFVLAPDRAAIDCGEYQLVVGPNLGAPAAGRGLGRFADLLGADALDLLSEVDRAEMLVCGSELAAELVYRPLRTRSGNVAVRPVTRGYEIPIGVAPQLPPERVIRPDELSVVHRDGRFRVIRSRDGRPVRVTAGHMLNDHGAPQVVRALAELCTDGITSVVPFDWGSLADHPFLPRVRYGRVVLAPAQWRFGRPGSLLGTGVSQSSPDDDDHLLAWRSAWRVPRHVYLSAMDNRLLLDLDDPGHRQQVWASLERSREAGIVLQEGLPGPEHAWLPGPRGSYAVELVVPLVRDPASGVDDDDPTPGTAGPVDVGKPGASAEPVAAQHVSAAAQWPSSELRRPPGSDWLYLSLRGTAAGEDALLTGPIGAMADQLVDDGVVYGWFFVRYADPDRELRLRLHGDPAALQDPAMPALMAVAAQAVARGERTAVVLQTYERELDRYGGPRSLALCEQIACRDSTAVRRILAAPGGDPALDRVDLAVVSLAGLLDSLAQSPADLAVWAKVLAGSGDDAAAAGKAFRSRKARLRALLGAASAPQVPKPRGTGDATARMDPRAGILGALADRARAVAPLAAELAALHACGVGLRPPAELVPSIAHLHLNRLGLDRPGEALVAGLLDRALRSLQAHPVERP